MEENHGHHEEFEIFVNSRRKEVNSEMLTFHQVAALAHDTPIGPNTLITITYEHGPHQNPEGTLLEGHSVKIKNGMRFNVTKTDKS